MRKPVADEYGWKKETDEKKNKDSDSELLEYWNHNCNCAVFYNSFNLWTERIQCNEEGN